MTAYLTLLLAGYTAVVLLAWHRSRRFAIFALVILSFPTWVGLALRPHLGPLGAGMPYLQLVCYLHFLSLMVRTGMRPWPVRVFITWPALWFTSATFMALPWGLIASAGLPPYGVWLPFILCAIGLLQSLWTAEETVDLRLRPEPDAHGPDGHVVDGHGSDRRLRRFPEGLGAPADAEGRRPLSIVQITDPHLGPFMSIKRLARICQRAVDRQPDLILITGDLMTMESQKVDVLAEALAPLSQYRGRVFACHGNHDHEARLVVSEALAKVGITLLIDQASTVSTAVGMVEVVGADFQWREREQHLARLCAEYPRARASNNDDGVPEKDGFRLLLLHDPGAFRHVPAGQFDLVLSGHTHGGQIGLVSFGLPHTFVSLVTTIPDHGPWARGGERLYVHRAQGHYGFPLRLGVPGEQSLLRVWR